MTRKIIKKLFDTYKCVLLPDNTTLAVDSEEATITLTKNETELLTKAQDDSTINKELEPILKKLTNLFYLGSINDSCFLYILTPSLRSAPSVMRAFVGCNGKTMDLSQDEYDYIDCLMEGDTP